MFSRSASRILSRTRPTFVRRNFFNIVSQGSKGIRMRFGKYTKTLEAGIRWEIPIIHRVVRVDMRDKLSELPRQSIISRDNVSYTVDGSVQYKVTDAAKSIFNVCKVDEAVAERAQLSMREILSDMDIDQVLHQREETATKITHDLKDLEDQWGVVVSLVKFRDIEFDDKMLRAMGRAAEADRNAKAKIISAQADIDMAKLFKEASAIYGENAVTMELRRMQMMTSVAKEPSNTIFFPSDVSKMFNSVAKGK
jgi:regulator of protease activity HflC (stomatin/prohibitin superfamily)